MSQFTKTLTAAAVAVVIATPVVVTYEGKELQAYLDPVDIPTICYGHTAGVKLGQIKTDAQCQALLEGELGRVIAQVDQLVTAPLPATRLAALGSFAYNVGVGNFKKSTLLRRLNAGEGSAACVELDRWVYAKGKKLPGLVSRRVTERWVCEWETELDELKRLAQQVDDAILVPLSQTRHTALTAYALNIGIAEFQISPVTKLLNGGHGWRACASLRTWPVPASTLEDKRRAELQRMCEVE